jgi:DNA polymerase III subunit chi
MATTDIGFYHLTVSPLEEALPKLLRKVLDSGQRAVVLAGSEERAEALNVVLWTYHPASWLPHGTRADGYADRQPIYLTHEEENPNGARVLVLVDGADPAFVGDFERCLDMFDGNDPDAVEAARERWRARKQAGFALSYFQQDSAGRWTRKDL